MWERKSEEWETVRNNPNFEDLPSGNNPTGLLQNPAFSSMIFALEQGFK